MSRPDQQSKYSDGDLRRFFLVAVGLMLAWRIVMNFEVVRVPIHALLSVISPFISGFVLAYVLNIPAGGIIKRLEKSNNRLLRRFKKTLGILGAYMLLVLLIFLVLRLIVPAIESGIAFFTANSPAFYARVSQFANYINEFDILGFDISVDGVIEQLRGFSPGTLKSSVESSLNAFFSVSSGLLKSFIAFISSVYILIEKDRFRAYACRILRAVASSSVYTAVLKYSDKLNRYFKLYIYTQSLDGLILGIVATIELALLRSPYAVIMGVTLGVLNLIPYFGSIVGSLIAVVVTIFTQGLPVGILAGVVLLITQQLDGNVLQPKLMGESFALSPLLIIISVTAGGAFFGIWGMMSAIPTAALLKEMLDDWLGYTEQRKAHTSEMTTVSAEKQAPDYR